MSNLAVQAQSVQESPFDSIRRTDADGEYWLGRELMPLLGYQHWHKFKPVIENAQDNIDSVGLKTREHFLPVELKSSGRKALDYKLSRLAAYHVALCCDSRGKESVKLAKHYFAIKTREAEVVIPAQNDRLREIELELQLQKAKNEGLTLKNSLVSIHGKELALRLMGDSEAIVEIKTVVTEVVDPATDRSVEIITAEQLKRLVKERTGQTLKNLKWFVDTLRAAGRDDLLVAVTRNHTSEYPIPDRLDDALSVVYRDRQKLIGE